jgi:hypothetical protein
VRVNRWMDEHPVRLFVGFLVAVVVGQGLTRMLVGDSGFWPGWIQFVFLDVLLGVYAVWMIRGHRRRIDS